MADVKLNEATAVTTAADTDRVPVIPSEAVAGDLQAATNPPEAISIANLRGLMKVYRGIWSNAVTYRRGDIVAHGGSDDYYISHSENNTNNTPGVSSLWVMIGGSHEHDTFLRFHTTPAWSSATAYHEGDIVDSEGTHWAARADVAAGGDKPAQNNLWVNIGDHYRGPHNSAYYYRRGDIVNRGDGRYYICWTSGTSNAPREGEALDWLPLGTSFYGVWSADKAPYPNGAIVKVAVTGTADDDKNLFISTAGNNSEDLSGGAETAHWKRMAAHEATNADLTAQSPSGAPMWFSVADIISLITAHAPTAGDGTPGQDGEDGEDGRDAFLGPWDSTVQYERGDIVYVAATTGFYISQSAAPTLGTTPQNNSGHWRRIDATGEGGGIDQATALALIASWARHGNNDRIPLRTKLRYAFAANSSSAIDNANSQYAAPNIPIYGWWPTSSGTSNIPAGQTVANGKSGILTVYPSGNTNGDLDEERFQMWVNTTTSDPSVWVRTISGTTYNPWRRIDHLPGARGLTATVSGTVLGGNTLTFRLQDEDGNNIGGAVSVDLPDIAFPNVNLLPHQTYTQDQWNIGAAGSNVLTLIAPTILRGAIHAQIPEMSQAQAESNETTKRATSAQRIGQGAKFHLPAATQAEIEAGADAEQKTIRTDYLKPAIETIARAVAPSGNGISGAPVEIGRVDGTPNLPLRTPFVINATGWGNYRNIQIVIEYGSSTGISHILPVIQINESGQSDTEVASDELTFEISNVQSSINRTVTDTENKLLLSIGSQIVFNDWQVVVYGYPGGASASAPPYITYWHRGLSNSNRKRDISTVVSGAWGNPANLHTAMRKFVADTGGIIASSNNNAALPSSAGLNWRTGSSLVGTVRVDPHAGDDGVNLRNGAVFSLDGNWKISMQFSVDNLASGGTRLNAALFKATGSGSNDDLVYLASDLGETSSNAVSALQSLPVETGENIDSAFNTVNLVTPVLNFSPDDLYYIAWFSQTSQQSRSLDFFNATITFEKK